MAYRDLVAQAIEELRWKTAAHDRLWHLGEADWSVDQDAGEIVFSAPNGIIATCPVQIIGTYATQDSTWLWAWEHPSVLPALTHHASRLREYGEANGIADLTTRKISVTDDQCWEFTALACKLNDAQGGYRGPSDSTFVFMTFGEPKLTGSVGLHVTTLGEAPSKRAESQFTSEIPADVRITLLGFIEALYDWEVAAWKASERDASSKTMTAAQEDYNALIRKWCVADVVAQPASFGSDPAHHPEREELVSAAPVEGVCRVRTQHRHATGFASDYEYRLRRQDGQWLIESLLYLDEEGEYEML